MGATIIEKNKSKTFTIILIGTNGSPATGKTVKVSFRDENGNYWSGGSWSPPHIDFTMTEDPVYPGVYSYTLASTPLSIEKQVTAIYEETTIPAYSIEEYIVKDLFTDVDDVLVDTNEIQGKLPNDYIMGSSVQTAKDDEIDDILTDTNEIQGKLPTNNIMGSSVKTDKDDEIDAIKLETDKMFAGAMGTPTAGSFSDNIMNKDGSQTFDPATDSLEAIRDRGDAAWAGTGATKEEIASAVWEVSIDGSHTGDEAGKVLYDMDAQLDDIETDTQDIQNRLPSSLVSGRMRSHLESKDSAVPLSAQEKLDVKAEADQAFVDYDPPTRAEATSDKDEIIAEVDVNEGKIDNLQTDSTQIIADIANLDGDLVTHDAAIKTLIGTPSPDLVTNIQNAEDNIRGADSDDLKTLSDQNDGISAQISQIQNNVFFSTTVRENYQRPESGTTQISIKAQVFDNTGNPEDPDSDELYIKLTGSVSGTLVASTLMTKLAVGVYEYLYTISSSDNLENWEFEFSYDEGSVSKTHYRASRLSEWDSDLNDIQTKVDAMYVKTDSATPSPTIPAQITQHDVDNKALQRVKGTPDLMYVPSGRTQIDVEGGITAIATEIPVKLSDNLLSAGIVKIESEYIIYTGISSGELTGCTRGAYGTTPATHADAVEVKQSVLFPLRLTIKDNEGNMKAPDSAPTVEIDDWNGTQELAPTAMTLISTGLYGYNYIIDNGELPENKVFTYTTVVDSITAKTPHEVVIIDQIASSNEVAEGGTGEYILDQDGWYDVDGVKTLWTDAVKGYVRDSDTGAPLDDAYVSAYPIIDGEPIYSGRPTAESRTRPNGTWLMKIDAGTYMFVIEKDGFQIQGGGVVERTVG